tara:strand:+ start:2814 stop:3149 length:336 start_codon:yes stop_codon:yes gene_type:complete
MYVLFFLILAFIGYGALFYRWNPIFMLLGIGAIVILMLVPMDSDIFFETTTTIDGSQFGETTDITQTDQIVLFSLTEGWEYTAWIWMHVFILITHGVFFFRYMMSMGQQEV